MRKFDIKIEPQGLSNGLIFPLTWFAFYVMVPMCVSGTQTSHSRLIWRDKWGARSVVPKRSIRTLISSLTRVADILATSSKHRIRRLILRLWHCAKVQQGCWWHRLIKMRKVEENGEKNKKSISTTTSPRKNIPHGAIWFLIEK